jgi:NADPH-dependent curcumin reductase CurA
MNWQRKKDQVERKESEGIENECIKACLELFKGANYGKILVKITLSFI